MSEAAEGGQMLAEADIRAFCQDRLSRNKVPSRVYFVDRLPRSGFGKVVKKELIALWEAIESRGAGR